MPTTSASPIEVAPVTLLFEGVRSFMPHKQVLEALIKAGAFDGHGPNRPSTLADLVVAMTAAEQAANAAAAGQNDMFGTSMPAPAASPCRRRRRL